MKKRLLLCFLIVLIGCLLTAQSIYSFYGPAEISYQRDTFGSGMGGVGIGDLFRHNTTLLNPALSTTIDRVHFSTAVSMGNIYYKDAENHTFRDDQVFLPYFNIIIPVSNHRFGVHYQNISSGKLDTEKQLEVSFDDEIFEVTEIQRQAYTLFKAGLFYAHKNDIVNFGLGLNYMFGHNVRFSQQRFDELDYLSGRFEIEHTFSNPSFDIGLAKIYKNISTGVSFSLPVDLKGDNYFKTNTLNEHQGDAVYEYPARAALGITYKILDNVFITTDFDVELWGDTNNFENSVDTYRAALGMSWEGNRHSRNFLAQIPFRAGISTRNLPFEINGHQIYEMAYYSGLSFPLKQYESYLQVAFKYFTRGDELKHEYSEDGFLFTIGTSGFDFFTRRTDRKAPRDIPMPDRRY